MKGKENKHTINFAKTKLKAGEEVSSFLEGWIGEMMGKGENTQRNGALILTNERVCFYRQGFMGEVFETIPLSKITSIEVLTRLGYRVIRLHTSHDELSFKTFEPKDIFERTYDLIEKMRHKDNSPQHTHTSTLSLADEIKKLADIRDKGIISDEEFNTLKSRLLGT